MTYSQISSCPQCGAPIYVPTLWGGVTPPSPMYSCNCHLKGNMGYQHTNTIQNPGFLFNPTNLQKEKNKKAMEELFEAIEESKQNDLKDATESLKDAFEKNGVLKEQTDKEKRLLKQIELLESSLKTLEKELGHLKDTLKSL